jgi:hypothetical protein
LSVKITGVARARMFSGPAFAAPPASETKVAMAKTNSRRDRVGLPGHGRKIDRKPELVHLRRFP